MSIPSEHDSSQTAAPNRDAIDAGKRAEKVAGFDPAAPPMETDAEAGVIATVPERPPLPPMPVKEPGSNALSHGSATSKDNVKGLRGWPIVLLLALVAAIALAAFSLGSRAL